MKHSDFLDLDKYIMALMVAAIHTELFPNILYPWLRLAVPMFYIISSYFLFCRLNNVREDEKRLYVKKYIIRNLKYYLFWFVLLLPYTVIARSEWFSEGIFDGLRMSLTHLLFSGTFSGSWFITGLIWGAVILYATRRLPVKVMIPVLGIVYIFCSMCSSYRFLALNNRAIYRFVYCYEYVFTNPVNSFPAATVWMFVGKAFAEKTNVEFKRMYALGGTLFFAVCLWCESRGIVALGGELTSDCYLFLLPLSVCMFVLIKDVDVTLKYAKTLRTISIIMYPLHTSVAGMIRYLFSSHERLQNGLALFVMVVLISHIAAFFIMKFENCKYLKILKYSH